MLENKSPHELLYNSIPPYESLRSFGCLCYAATLVSGRDKFSSRVVPAIFVGYPKGIRAITYMTLPHTIFLFPMVSFFMRKFSYFILFPPLTLNRIYFLTLFYQPPFPITIFLILHLMLQILSLSLSHLSLCLSAGLHALITLLPASEISIVVKFPLPLPVLIQFQSTYLMISFIHHSKISFFRSALNLSHSSFTKLPNYLNGR